MRVLVVSDKSIYGKGLCALLAQQNNLEVIGQEGDGYQVDLAAKVESLRPDVLILDCSFVEADPLPWLMRCLKDRLVQKIITVDRQDDTLCVFSGERRVVAEVANLVETITEPTRSSCAEPNGPGLQ